MALQLVSDVSFPGRNPIPPRAPLPPDAAAYADFMTGLHLTPAGLATVDNTSPVFLTTASLTPGFYYDQDGVIQRTTAARWTRREFDARSGLPLGLRIEGAYTQRVVSSQRQVLTNGTAVGAVIAPSGSAAEPWQQWYSLTPSGAGEASVTFATSAIATAGTNLYTSIDARGSGIVQVGSAGTGHANFNLRTGQVQAFDGAAAQMIPRPGGIWTLFVRGLVPVGGLEDVAIYAASVAAMDTPKRGASGIPAEIISPRLYSAGAANRGWAHPWPDTATATHNAESLQPNYTGWTQNGDFSCVFSLRTGAIPGAAGSSFAVLGTNGISIRAGGNGNMFVVNSANNQGIWDSGVPYRALTQYRVGISRTGDRVAVAINDRGFEIAGLSLGGVLRIGGAANTTTHEFVGWLEKAIFWVDGRPQARLLQMMETWL
ncbi:hypothetical protein [Paracoccus sp. (in: a-proteobacteria)]|uniref:hypothetical protein n=1 Tax=Paracoccus sp. TaxID=267 RepID=UPI00272D4069|nr:hypothetical protein [Paracoccus sp. (in: a-proteobacteria)]